MNALILVLFCQAASVSAGNTGFRVGMGVQFLGGYSHSPVITGPDSAPLLNLQPLAAGQYQYNLILTPGLTFRTKARNFTLELAYTPRIYLDLTQISATPTVFNILGGRLILGKPADYLLTLTPTLSLGGIGASGLGTLSTAVSPATVASKPGTTNTANGSYASAAVQARLDHPINRGWAWDSVALASLLMTPEQFVDTSGTINANGALVQSLTRGDWLNEWHYRINSENFIIYTAQLGWVDFTTASYSTVLASVGWDGQLSKATQLHTRVGLMEYWTGNFARQYNLRSSLAILEVGLTHTFTDWGLPRMRGGVSAIVGPYVDIVFGTLEPRTTIQADLAYEFNRSLTGTLQLRDYTEEYFNGKSWRPVPVGHDKNVAIVQAQLKYKYKSWLSYSLGAYSLLRWLVPSNTDPTQQVQDYFVFVGAEGAYDLE